MEALTNLYHVSSIGDIRLTCSTSNSLYQNSKNKTLLKTHISLAFVPKKHTHAHTHTRARTHARTHAHTHTHTHTQSSLKTNVSRLINRMIESHIYFLYLFGVTFFISCLYIYIYIQGISIDFYTINQKKVLKY